jgi:hypothetical protein
MESVATLGCKKGHSQPCYVLHEISHEDEERCVFIYRREIELLTKEDIKFYYEQVALFAAANNITTFRAWFKLVKCGNRPYWIPPVPDKFFKNRGYWFSWGDFLLTGRVSTHKIQSTYVSYNVIKTYCLAQNINTPDQYVKLFQTNKLPAGFPLGIEKIYGIKLLDTLAPKKMKYLTYQEAKGVLYPLKLTALSFKIFKKLNIKELASIPASYERVYKNSGEWISYYDFFGTEDGYKNKHYDKNWYSLKTDTALYKYTTKQAVSMWKDAEELKCFSATAAKWNISLEELVYNLKSVSNAILMRKLR